MLLSRKTRSVVRLTFFVFFDQYVIKDDLFFDKSFTYKVVADFFVIATPPRKPDLEQILIIKRVNFAAD